MLTIQAFNALLKTLEEPPAHVIFILATTEVNKLPLTILSRCQRFDFRGITIDSIVKRLKTIIDKENIDIKNNAIVEIAKQADGSMRDAISLLDQIYSFTEGQITEKSVYDVSGSVRKETLLKLVENTLNKDVPKAFKALNEIIEDGKEISKIVNDLILLLRDVLIIKNVRNDSKQKDENLDNVAKNISNDKIYFYLEVLNQTQNDIKWTTQKRAYLELAIVKIIDHQTLDRIDSNEKINMLMNRINQLELDLKNVNIKNVKVIQKEENKPDIKQKDVISESNGLRKPVTVKEISEILNNGDKQKKETLLKIWPALNRVKGAEEVIAKLLSQAEIVASTKEKALLVYPNKTMCIMMLNEKYKTNALDLLNRKNKYINDYVCIDKESWDELYNEFFELWQKNKRVKPKLKERNLGIYETKDEKWEPETVRLAKEFFGEDKVIVEE